MKLLYNFLLAGVILTGIFFMTTGCAKKTTTPTPAPVTTVPSYTFNALGITATGVQYTITNPTAGPLTITGTNGNGTNTNDQTVKITINSAVNSVGTYTLSSSTNNTGVYSSGSNSYVYTTNSSPNVGTLTVSKINLANKVMSVSFSFNAQQVTPTLGNSTQVYGSFDNVGYN